MPYAVHWDEADANLLWLHFTGDLTWKEYGGAFTELAACVRERPGRVDAILFAETAVPSGNPIPYFRQALQLLAELDNLGLFVSVNPSMGRFARVMVETLARLDVPGMAGRVPFVTTTDDAYRLIAANRAKNRTEPPASPS